MSRLMYDSVNYLHPPRDAAMVAGYVTGPYAWPAIGWARWARVPCVHICTIPSSNVGEVLDVEQGDASPQTAVGWIARARARGQVPTVYCSVSQVDAVRAECKAHEIDPPLFWVAHWDGIAELPAGAVAKQYQDDPQLGYDVSIVADYWPGVDPAPKPSPHPEDSRMFTLIDFGEQGVYMVYDDHVMVAVLTPADENALKTLPTCHGMTALDVTMFERFRAVAPAVGATAAPAAV